MTLSAPVERESTILKRLVVTPESAQAILCQNSLRINGEGCKILRRNGDLG